MEDLISRLDRWMKANHPSYESREPGASDKNIDDLESKLGVKVPDGLRQLLRWRSFVPIIFNQETQDYEELASSTRLLPQLGLGLGDTVEERPVRRRALPWAELLRRVFAIDIRKCDQCGGDMKIIAIIPASEATEAILDHLGIDTSANPAKGPPKITSAA